jgi:hypothetical protein
MEIMNFIAKNWPSVLLLIAGILAVAGSFISSTKDTQQKDSIERLGNENLNLSKEIHKLNILNEDISEKVKKIVTENNKTSAENLQLSQHSKELISEVQHLIIKVDSTTTNEAAENKKTGELFLTFNSEFKKRVSFKVGGNSFALTLDQIRNGAQIFASVNKDPLSIKVVNNKLLISMRVFDIDGNLIAEIEDNFWRPNPNLTAKFNYDDHGFEVADNKGNIVVSINITATNEIEIQGIFAIKESKLFYIAGSNGFNLLSFKNPDMIALVYKKYNLTYEDFLNSKIQQTNITQLFEYTGKNWLHKRKMAN